MERGIIFDLDGVLLDYSYRFHQTYADVLRAAGLPCPPRERLMAMRRQCANSQAEVLDRFLVPSDWPNRDAVIAACASQRERIIEEPAYVRLDRFFDGVWDVVADLRERLRYRTAVITRRKNAALFAQQLGEHQALFDFVETTFDKAAAMRQFVARFALERCYFLTDTANDIVAGKRAGLIVIGVLTGLENAERLATAGADDIIATVGDIVAIVGRAA